MEIRTYSNLSRPGVGKKPQRESQRPLLPQHSRHCPVLEAGSGLGFLVYPPLQPDESYHIGYEGEGKFRFQYFMRSQAGKWEPLFVVDMQLPVGSIGMIHESVPFVAEGRNITPDGAKRMARAFVIPEDMGTPPGAVALRGATNFQTPEGWDTVYSPIFNMIERPMAPMLTVRVETDWFPHESEFRYILQPGEGIAGSHSMPIGQVFFVPREEITLTPLTEEEEDAMREAKGAFFEEKAKHRVTTRYGLEYSPHYINESRRQNS